MQNRRVLGLLPFFFAATICCLPPWTSFLQHPPMVSSILKDIYKAYNPCIYGESPSQKRSSRNPCVKPLQKNERAYRCDLCGNGFIDLLQYIGHTSSNEQCRSMNHFCLNCGEGFTTYFNLAKHTSTRHASGKSATLRTPIRSAALGSCSHSNRITDSISIGRVRTGTVTFLRGFVPDPLPDPGFKLGALNSSSRLAQLVNSPSSWGRPGRNMRPVTLFAHSPSRNLQPRALQHSAFENRDFDARLHLKDIGMWHSQESMNDMTLAKSFLIDRPYTTTDYFSRLQIDRTDFVLLERSVAIHSDAPTPSTRFPLTVCANPHCQSLIAEKDSEITRLHDSMLQLLRTSRFMSQQQLESARYSASLSCEVNERVQTLRRQVKLIKTRSSLLIN